MTIVVTDNCLGCRFTECVTVCPVAAFRRGEQMLYIDPTVCIDCYACVPKCPVSAIFDEFDLPDDKRVWVEINANESRVNPTITAQRVPLLGAEQRKSELGF